MNPKNLLLFKGSPPRLIFEVPSFRKAVAVLTCISFICTSVVPVSLASSVRDENLKKQSTAVQNEFILPYTVGRITDYRDYGTRDVIVNIQDLHCHPEVQRNISRIIGLIDEQSKLKCVYSEGASKDLDTSWICGICDGNIEKDIADALVESGRLGGDEYYSIISKKYNLIKGLENPKVYERNSKRLARILERKEEFSGKIQELRKRVESLGEIYLGNRNKRFKRLVEDFRSGSVSASKYYKLLIKYAEESGIYLEEYGNISGFLEIMELQKKLDYGRISSELQRYMQELRAKVSFSEYSRLKENLDDPTRHDEFYLNLSAHFNKSAGKGGAYRHLKRFFEFIEKNQEVNTQKLVREEERLVRSIFDFNARSVSEKETAYLGFYLDAFSDYLAGQVSPENHAEVKENRERFKLLWSKYVGNDELFALEGAQALLDEYYRVNGSRNAIFLSRMLSGEKISYSGGNDEKSADKMIRKGRVIAVLTGGFHTKGLVELLNKNRLSYVVITPNVTSGTEFSTTVYERLIKEQARINAQGMAIMKATQGLAAMSREQRIEQVQVGFIEGKWPQIFDGTDDKKSAAEKLNDVLQELDPESAFIYDQQKGESRFVRAGKVYRINVENGLAVVEELETAALHFNALILKGRREEVDVTAEITERSGSEKISVPNVLDDGEHLLNNMLIMTKAEMDELCRGLGIDEEELGSLVSRAYAALTTWKKRELNLDPDSIKNKRILLSLLAAKKSKHLSEDCSMNAFIGINRTLFEMAKTNKEAAKLLFIWLMAHEMRHEAGMKDERTEFDVELIVDLMIERGVHINKTTGLLGGYVDNGGFLSEVKRAYRDKTGEMVKAAVYSMKDSLSEFRKKFGLATLIGLSFTIFKAVFRGQAPTEAPAGELDTMNIDAIIDELMACKDPITRSFRYNETVAFIEKYSKIVEITGRDYPVEAPWPVLKAIVQLTRKEEDEIIRIIRAKYRMARKPVLADDILLMNRIFPKDWLREQAPNLEGVKVYFVAAEKSHWSGGLGPVMVFHSRGMKELGADIETVEPGYQYRSDREDPEKNPLDYSEESPTKLTDIQELFRCSVVIGDKPVNVSVSMGIDPAGVPSLLVKDIQSDGNSKFTKMLYNYQKPFNPISWEEFTAFLCAASAEMINMVETKRLKELGGKWKPPIVHTNDGQTGPFEAMVRSRYADNPVMMSIVRRMFFTTHTYRNVGPMYPMYDATEPTNSPLRFLMGIKKRLFPAFNQKGNVNYSAGGVRLPRVAGTVAKQHRADLLKWNWYPGAVLRAITNGAVPEMMAKYFRQTLNQLFPEADVERPEAKQIQAVKKTRKNALNDMGITTSTGDKLEVHADRILIGNARRLVEEKEAMGDPKSQSPEEARNSTDNFRDATATTWENVLRIVKKGGDLVIFGLHQGTDESNNLALKLEKWERTIKELKKQHPEEYKGSFQFVKFYTPDQKIAFLSAMDIQFQPSTRGTGAAEYTEEDISANGGLQMSPPYNEGIIMAQGLRLDWKKPGKGNTIIPKGNSPKDWGDAFDEAIDVWQKRNDDFYEHCATSVRLNRVLYYLLSCAAYLRNYDGIVKHDNEELEQDRQTKEAIVRAVDGNSAVVKALLYDGRNGVHPYHFNGHGPAETAGLRKFIAKKLQIEEENGYNALYDHLKSRNFASYIMKLFDGLEVSSELEEWFSRLERSPGNWFTKNERLNNFILDLADALEKSAVETTAEAADASAVEVEPAETDAPVKAEWSALREGSPYHSRHSEKDGQRILFQNAGEVRDFGMKLVREGRASGPTKVKVKAGLMKAYEVEVIIEGGIRLTEQEIGALIEAALDRTGAKPDQMPDTLVFSLLDRSTHLGEDHLRNGFIGINKSYIEMREKNADTAQAMLKTVVYHELCHEVTGLSGDAFESEQLKYDARFAAKQMRGKNTLDGSVLAGYFTNGVFMGAVDFACLSVPVLERARNWLYERASSPLFWAWAFVIFGLFLYPASGIPNGPISGTVFNIITKTGVIAALVFTVIYLASDRYERQLSVRPMLLNPLVLISFAYTALMWFSNLRNDGWSVDLVGPVALSGSLITGFSAMFYYFTMLSGRATGTGETRYRGLPIRERFSRFANGIILSVLGFTWGFEFAQGLGWDTANNSRGTFDPMDLALYAVGTGAMFAIKQDYMSRLYDAGFNLTIRQLQYMLNSGSWTEAEIEAFIAEETAYVGNRTLSRGLAAGFGNVLKTIADYKRQLGTGLLSDADVRKATADTLPDFLVALKDYRSVNGISLRKSVSAVSRAAGRYFKEYAGIKVKRVERPSDARAVSVPGAIRPSSAARRPATLPSSRITGIAMVDELLIAPVKELGHFSAILARYLTDNTPDKREFNTFVQMFFRAQGYASNGVWTLREMRNYRVFYRGMLEIVQRASVSRHPRLSLVWGHFLYNWKDRRSGRKLSMTLGEEEQEAVQYVFSLDDLLSKDLLTQVRALNFAIANKVSIPAETLNKLIKTGKGRGVRELTLKYLLSREEGLEGINQNDLIKAFKKDVYLDQMMWKLFDDDPGRVIKDYEKLSIAELVKKAGSLKHGTKGMSTERVYTQAVYLKLKDYFRRNNREVPPGIDLVKRPLLHILVNYQKMMKDMTPDQQAAFAENAAGFLLEQWTSDRRGTVCLGPEANVAGFFGVEEVFKPEDANDTVSRYGARLNEHVKGHEKGKMLDIVRKNAGLPGTNVFWFLAHGNERTHELVLKPDSWGIGRVAITPRELALAFVSGYEEGSGQAVFFFENCFGWDYTKEFNKELEDAARRANKNITKWPVIVTAANKGREAIIIDGKTLFQNELRDYASSLGQRRELTMQDLLTLFNRFFASGLGENPAVFVKLDRQTMVTALGMPDETDGLIDIADMTTPGRPVPATLPISRWFGTLFGRGPVTDAIDQLVVAPFFNLFETLLLALAPPIFAELHPYTPEEQAVLKKYAWWIVGVSAATAAAVTAVFGLNPWWALAVYYVSTNFGHLIYNLTPQGRKLPMTFSSNIEIINQNTRPDVKVAVFDWDDTIFDVSSLADEVDRDMIAKFLTDENIMTPEKALEWAQGLMDNVKGLDVTHKFFVGIKALMGKGVKAKIDPVSLKEIRKQRLDAKYQEAKAEWQRGNRERPLAVGIEKLLRELNSKGVVCVISSNAPQAEVQSRAKDLGLDGYFAEIHGAPQKKADTISRLKSEYDCGDNEIAMLGDSENDIKAAKEASCLSVAVSRNRNLRDRITGLGADIIVWGNYAGLMDALVAGRSLTARTPEGRKLPMTVEEKEKSGKEAPGMGFVERSLLAAVVAVSSILPAPALEVAAEVKALEAIINDKDARAETWYPAMKRLITLSKKYPKIVYENIRYQFEELTPQQKDEIIKRNIEVLGKEAVEDWMAVVEELKKEKKKLVYLNATFEGGGPAEMFQGEVQLLHALGVDIGWHKMMCLPGFFHTTKKLHNSIQGLSKDRPDWELYREMHELNAQLYEQLYRSENSVFYIDDPQPAAQVSVVKRINPSARVIARLHIDTSGTEEGGTGVEAWSELSPHWKKADVFLHQPGHPGRPLDVRKMALPPAINVYAKKCTPVSREDAVRIVGGILDDEKRPIKIENDENRWVALGRVDPAKGQVPGLLAFVKYLQQDPDAVLWYIVQFAPDDPEGYTLYLMLKLLIEDDPAKRRELKGLFTEALEKDNKEPQEINGLLGVIDRASERVINETPRGARLKDRVQLFHENLSNQLAGIAALSVGHQILSNREGYNMALSEMGLLKLPGVTTDIPAFRDRIVPGKRGGWFVHLSPEIAEMGPIDILKAYLDINDRKHNAVLAYRDSIVRVMDEIRDNPEKAKQVAEELRRWVLQNGNLLVNQTNRLALAAATAEELDSYGDINLLRRRVINRLRSAVAAGDAAGPQVKIPVTVPALVLPENRELAARWRLEGHSKWWIAVRVAEFEFKTSLDPIKFFNEHYAGRWGYEDHKTIRLMGVMALYAATFGATVSSVLLGMLWYWRVDPAVKLAGRFSKRVNILTSAVLNMLFRDIAYVMVKKEQGDDSLPPSDPRKGGPATLPGSRISAKILSFLTFGIFGRNAVTDAIDERVIAPIKELSRFSALLALYMTDKAKYIDAVEKFFIEHGYGGESDVPAFGEEATEWTVSEREAYTLFAHALGRIMETASHSRFPKLALWRLHLKYNLSPAVTKSGMRLPMTIEGDAVEKEEIDSKQSAQTVPSKRRAGRIHLAELLSEGDEIGADFEADVVLLCGTYDFDTFDKAFELYRTGKAKKILITGGFGRATADLLYHAVVTHKYPISVKGMVLKEEEDVMDYLSFLLGRTGRPGAEEMLKEFRAMNAAQFAQAISKAGISEAGIIKQVIMQKGKMSDRKVLDRDILVETESRNTNENFRFSRVILEGLRKQMGVDTLRVAYIMAPIYQFRARAVFNHELADDVAAGRIKGTSYSIGRSRDMFDENETNNLMAAEMWRFILYTAKGDIVPEHKGRLGLRIIPWNVWKEAMMIISTSPDKQKLISRLKAVAMNLKEEDGRTLTFPNVRVLSDKLDEMGILNTEVREFVHLVYGYEPTSLVEAGFEAAQSAVLAPSGVAAAEAIASGLCPIAETAPELVGKNYFIASETPDGYFFERVQKRGELGLRVIGVSPITSTIDPNSLIGLSAYSKAEAGGKLFRVYAQKAGANGIILYYEPVAGVSHEKAVLAVAALLKDNHAIRDKLGLGDEEFDIDVIETESDFSGFENAVPEFGGRAAYFGETVGVTALSSVRAYSDLEMAEAKAGCDVVLDESRDAATQFKDVGTFTKIKKAKESVIRSHSPISVNTGLPEGAGMGEKLDSLYRKANALKIQSGIDTILLELTEQDLIDMDFGKLAGTTAALAEAGIKLHARFVVGAKTSVLEAKGTITKLVSARVAGISLDLSGIADESRIEGILRYARALNPDLVVSAKLGSISGKLKSLVDASEIVTVRDINVEAGGVIKDAAPSDARTWYQIRVRDGAMLDDGSLARLFEAVRNMGAWAVGIPMPEEGAYGKITMENVVEQVSMLVKHKIGQLAVGRIETYPQAYEIAWAMDEAGLPEEADGRITDFLKKCKGLRMAEPEAVDTMMYAIEDLLNAPRMNLPGMSAVKAYTASKLAKMQKTPDSELKKAYVEAVAGYLRGIQERVLAAQYRGTDPALASAAHQKLFGWALLEAVFTAGTVDARGYDRVAEAYRKAVPTSGSTAKDRSVLTLMDIKGFTETSSYETVEVKAAESLLAIKSMLDGPKDGFSIANAVVGVLTLVPLAEKDLSFKKTVEKKSLPAAQEGIRKLLGAA